MTTDYDTDCQASKLWTMATPWTYAGKVRDEHGRALCGFKVQDSKKTRKVSIVNNGHYQRHYRFPLGLTVPRHPMNRWLNVPMCGMLLADEAGKMLSNDEAIKQAVFAGKKPVGDLVFSQERAAERDALVEEAKARGFEVLVYTLKHNADTHSFVMFGDPAPLKELFDLNAIREFYRNGAGVYGGSHSLLRKAEAEKLTAVQVLHLYDWASPQSPEELIVTGLCLGYAFESTLAVIIEHFGSA